MDNLILIFLTKCFACDLENEIFASFLGQPATEKYNMLTQNIIHL